MNPALSFARRLIIFSRAACLPLFGAAALLAGAVLSACAMPKGRGWVVRPGGGMAWQAGRDAAMYAGFLALFLLAVTVVSGTTYNPFIYYRF